MQTPAEMSGGDTGSRRRPSVGGISQVLLLQGDDGGREEARDWECS
jgi:hypothetical protein